MKFETKMTKLGIDENEVKSIIGACECGEINGAYFIDLTKLRKWEIMEVIGNDLDADLYSEGEFYSGNKRMSAFCKAYGIEESEIADYFALGISNQGCDIAYTLESNEDVILVLTDDEKYHNSFIKYASSQENEEESSFSSSIEELTAEYDAKINELTQLDDETDMDVICIDKELMVEYESKKAEIENEISEIEEQIEKTQELEESQMEEEYVSFKLESKDDSRIYLAGEVDITTIDDTDGGDWSYEQNDGTYGQHIPSYWKTDMEDLSDDFQDFIDNIDWDSFRQALCDFATENRTFEYGDYYLHINDGASVEIEITKYADFDDTYKGTAMFKYNGELIIFDDDLIRYLGSDISFDGFRVTSFSSVDLFLPREFADYPSESTEEMVSDMLEVVCKYYAEQLTRNAGVMPRYNELVEQEVEDIIASDKEAMWKFKTATKNNAVEEFLKEYDFEIDD